MRSGTIAIVCGLMCALYLPGTPDTIWFAFLPVLALFACTGVRTRLPMLFALGWLWAGLHVHMALSARPGPQWHGTDLVVEGTVSSIPNVGPLRTRFVFDIDRTVSPDVDFRSRVILNWYRGAERLRAGDRWRLRVKLKQPHGYMNPGGFDYERWLFARRVGAVGYVRDNGFDVQRLGVSRLSLQRLRQRSVDMISTALEQHPSVALVVALGVGHKGLISDHQWAVLRDTGTSYLMAISGLHVGLVAALVYWLAATLWGLCPLGARLLATPRFAAAMALASAVTYAALAGFSVPTQRALILVAVVMVASLWQRHLVPSRCLALAALGVVIFDPFSVLSAGFWLSFFAVVVMLLALPVVRAERSPRGAGVWRRWGKVHLVITLGLAPLTVFYFDAQSLLAPLANFVAVPGVSVVVVPTILFGMVLSVFDSTLGGYVLQLGAWSLFALWAWLEWLSTLGFTYEAAISSALWVAVVGCVGVLVALLPAGVPGKWTGWVVLVLLWNQQQRPLPPASAEVTVLDVGQGLSVVVRAHNRVLVYDAGPRYDGGFDTGRMVVVPYLRAKGVTRIDVLVVSHGDRDHAGGVASIISSIQVDRIISNADVSVSSEPCVKGKQWHWGATAFEVMSPQSVTVTDSNDNSCVLRIRHPSATVLLPGDIESATEREMLRSYAGTELTADVLVAPHHGSRTSSTTEFVAAVSPTYVVFPVGFKNRYGFPMTEVVARYEGIGTRIYRSDMHGAVTFRFNAGEAFTPPNAYREQARRRWHW